MRRYEWKQVRIHRLHRRFLLEKFLFDVCFANVRSVVAKNENTHKKGISWGSLVFRGMCNFIVFAGTTSILRHHCVTRNYSVGNFLLPFGDSREAGAMAYSHFFCDFYFLLQWFFFVFG